MSPKKVKTTKPQPGNEPTETTSVPTQMPEETPAPIIGDEDVHMDAGESVPSGANTEDEIARLRAEITRLTTERDMARLLASSMQERLSDVKEALNEQKDRVAELKDDNSRYRRKYNEAEANAKSWREKAEAAEDCYKDLDEDFSNLEEDFNRYQADNPERREDAPSRTAENEQFERDAQALYEETDTRSGIMGERPEQKRGDTSAPKTKPTAHSKRDDGSARWSEPTFDGNASGNSKAGVKTSAYRRQHQFLPKEKTMAATSHVVDMHREEGPDLAKVVTKAGDKDLEWTGRWHVNPADPESANAWRIRDTQQVSALVTGTNRTRIDPTLQETQRLLINGARLVPLNHRSAAQTEVVEFATWAESAGNHPLRHLNQTGTGVRRGTDGTLNALDITVQRFITELRPNTGHTDHQARIGRINHLMREIFSHPNSYRRLVDVIDPNTGSDIYADPVNETVLSEANRINAVTFPDGVAITHLSVTRWLWSTLRISRAIAQHLIEPYFRRQLRHTLAARTLERLADQPNVSDQALAWIQMFGIPNARSQFFTVTDRRYTVRDLSRSIWQTSGGQRWRWVLPAAPPGVVDQPPMQTLAADTSFGEIDVTIDWLPDHVRQVWEPLYTAAVTAVEQEDLLAAPVVEPMEMIVEEDAPMSS
ncbi:hypothetical protein RSOL_340620, partial [Rhizoctonia solani AG-3 Rhs1AP]